jgi:phosphatidylinositol alpha 1,6-mannosyltransferase
VGRILHVSDCYAPRLGGIEVQVSDLARAQQAAGCTVAVVTATPRDVGRPDAEPEAGPVVHRVTAGLPFALPVHPRAASRLRRLFAELAPDVVHVHVGAVSPFAWSAVHVAVGAGLPTVVSVHSIWDRATRRAYRALTAAEDWTRWPLVVAPVSSAVAERVEQVTRGAVRMRVVPNGLDLSGWRPAPPPCPLPAAARRPELHVVAVGRLAPRKRSLALVRVLRTAAGRMPDGVALRATLVGDGPAEPLVRSYLRRSGMTGQVRLTGRLPRAELPGLLADADVFLAPAVREAFGLAALEARTAGLPVVARAGTGIADFVTPGLHGLLADDDPGLALALAELAAAPETLAKMRETNRSEPWTDADWPEVLPRLQECYAEARALARNPGSGPGRL